MAPGFANSSAQAQQTVTFQRETRALFKIDERPVKLWEIFLSEKKKNLILMQLGRRFLLLDTQERVVFELAPETVEIKSNKATWRAPHELPHEPAASADVKTLSDAKILMLPSENWQQRDVGTMRRFQVKLSAEGRTLELQLPLTLSQQHIF
ncbi:MAG TPA: hypothetical protein VNL38_00255 [Candidatus Nitrosotenuis sp.]|nr:hypothetical protein [Candidatus Nitrosotenuis sp.]